MGPVFNDGYMFTSQCSHDGRRKRHPKQLCHRIVHPNRNSKVQTQSRLHSGPRTSMLFNDKI